MKDLSDSFAIVELNEPLTDVFLSENAEAKNDAGKTSQENCSSIEETTPTEIAPFSEKTNISNKDENNGVKNEECASEAEKNV